MPTIVFTVTNELNHDQRMQRICHSLTKAGYQVLLVGRKKRGAKPLTDQIFIQKRLRCFTHKGAIFYVEFNIRLFLYLLFTKATILCAIDLDTILPVYFASKMLGIKRVYDAHEYFTEQKEIIRRPKIQRIWKAIEAFAIPRFPSGYTVNNWIATSFEAQYGVTYAVIRNLPRLTRQHNNQLKTIQRNQTTLNLNHLYTQTIDLDLTLNTQEKFFLYQGAINEGRSFETLLPAMKQVDCKLQIYGTGNFINQSLSIINDELLANKVSIFEPLIPTELKQITPTAFAGITLFDAEGANQYHSLANRFFDYIMAGIPQICVDYPEYRAINQQFEVAFLIKNTAVETIAAGLNKLLNDPVLYKRLKLNCLEARKTLNWEQEESVLLNFYKNLIP